MEDFNEKYNYIKYAYERLDTLKNLTYFRASILLATNTLLISAMFVLLKDIHILVMNLGVLFFYIFIPLVILFLITLSLSIFNTVFTIFPKYFFSVKNVFNKEGGNIKLHSNLLNVFNRIVKMSGDDYLKSISTLTKKQIIEDMSYGVHNLSLIMSQRYQNLKMAHTYFFLTLVLFLILFIIYINCAIANY